MLMLYIHMGIRVYSCGLAFFCASSSCFTNKFMLFASNVEMSLEDLMYENVRVENYQLDHV